MRGTVVAGACNGELGGWGPLLPLTFGNRCAFSLWVLGGKDIGRRHTEWKYLGMTNK